MNCRLGVRSIGIDGADGGQGWTEHGQQRSTNTRIERQTKGEGGETEGLQDAPCRIGSHDASVKFGVSIDVSIGILEVWLQNTTMLMKCWTWSTWGRDTTSNHRRVETCTARRLSAASQSAYPWCYRPMGDSRQRHSGPCFGWSSPIPQSPTQAHMHGQDCRAAETRGLSRRETAGSDKFALIFSTHTPIPNSCTPPHTAALQAERCRSFPPPQTAN